MEDASQKVQQAAALYDKWKNAQRALRTLRRIMAQPMPAAKRHQYHLKIARAIVVLRNSASQFETLYKTFTPPEKFELSELRPVNGK